MKRQVVFMVVTLGALGAVWFFFVICGIVGKGSGTHEFQSLLNGDSVIGVTEIEFVGQRKRVLLRDPSAMAYLSAQFRSARRSHYEPGLAYYANVVLSTGRSAKCAVYVGPTRDRLSVLFPIDDLGDGVSYLVSLTQPIPKTLAERLGILRQ